LTDLHQFAQNAGLSYGSFREGYSFGAASKRTSKMKLRFISTAFAISLLPAAANAQVVIDMGAFTCSQYLAMPLSMSVNFSAWMSGWYSYQTRRTFVDILAHQNNIAKVKSWCQYNPQANIMNALQTAIGPQ
jgi:HdeA/HdeB family